MPKPFWMVPPQYNDWFPDEAGDVPPPAGEAGEIVAADVPEPEATPGPEDEEVGVMDEAEMGPAPDDDDAGEDELDDYPDEE